MKTEPTYIERAAVLKSESSTAELQTIAEIHARMHGNATAGADYFRDAINDAREIGIHLQALCGHEQIDFKFWHDHCAGTLPFSFDSAKIFVSTARKMPRKAETLGEAAQFIQSVLVADCILQLPERAETQNRANISMVQRFFAEFTLMRQPFKKIVAQQPMEQWDAPALDEFLLETEWLATERDRAAKLRAAK